jgi:DNA polymerase-3 subunit delta
VTDVSPDAPVHLVKGDDDVLLRDAAHRVVHALAGDLDPGLAVEEVGRERFAPPDASEASIVPLVDAAQTPPFLTDRRVVVGRDIEMFTKAAQVAPLVDYLADPLPSTSLVLVWSGGRIPKALTDAVSASGGVVVDTSPGRKLAGWIDEQVAASGLRLDRDATDRLARWLGDDPQRLVGVLATLVGSFGQGARLGADDIEPFLGEAGGVPPWELTDALDKGDIAASLSKLHRMTEGGGRHALQIMATLQNHYGRMLMLDGAAVTGEKDAARVLGLKGSTFPARKALTQARKLGHDGVVRAVDLLAGADIDLRGGKAWPDDLVLEVLVARLARLAR